MATSPGLGLCNELAEEDNLRPCVIGDGSNVGRLERKRTGRDRAIAGGVGGRNRSPNRSRRWLTRRFRTR